MKIFIFIFFVCVSSCFSQNDSLKIIIKEYNANLELLTRNSQLYSEYIQKKNLSDITSLNDQLMKVNQYSEAKFISLRNNAPSDLKLQLLKSENSELTNLNFAFVSTAGNFENVAAKLTERIEEIKWLKSQQSTGAALGDCPECLFTSKIAVYVVKDMGNNRIDTLQCNSIQYFKKVNGIPIDNNKFKCISYPCSQNSEPMVSTGRNYTFIVKADKDGKEQQFTIDKINIPPRRSKDFIYPVFLKIR